MKKHLITGLLALTLAAQCFSGSDLLIREISPKDASMAGTSASFGGDGLAAFVNPASISLSERASLSALYHNLYASSILGAISYIQPILTAGTFSISGAVLDMGEIEERDSSNLLTGTFTDKLTSIKAAYSFRPSEYAAFGAAVNYINHSFYGENANALGADAGILINLQAGFSASFAVNNIVKPSFKYKNGGEDVLPIRYNLTAGSEIKEIIPGSVLRIGLGLSGEEYFNLRHFSAGAETVFFEGLFGLRAGLSDTGFSTGFFAAIAGADFSYAWTARDMEPLHRFCFSYSFGQNIRETEKQLKTLNDKLKYEIVEKIRRETITNLKSQAEELSEKGNYEEALAACEKGLIWSPNDPWFTDMAQSLNTKINRQKVQQNIAEAKKLMSDNLLIDAMVKLRTALELDPGNQEAKDLAESTESAIQKLSDANIEAEVQNKKLIKEYFSKGLAKYTLKDYKAAIEEWDKVIKLSPLQRQVYGYIKSAQENIARQQETKIKQDFKKEQEKNDLYNRAVLLYTQGKFEESLNLWKKLLELDPGNAEAKGYLGKITEEFKKLQRQNLGW